jgi:hypothetical protein
MLSMVVLNQDIKNLPVEKRVQALRELKEKTKVELEKIKKEKESEIAEADKEIAEDLTELWLDDRRRRTEQEDVEEKHKAVREKKEIDGEAGRMRPRHARLEDAVAGSLTEGPADWNGAKEQKSSAEVMLEHLVPSSLYDLTRHELYHELHRLETKAYLSPEEQRRIVEVNSNATAITATYSRRDLEAVDEARNNYLHRTEDLLKRLNDRLHRAGGNIYRPGGEY